MENKNLIYIEGLSLEKLQSLFVDYGFEKYRAEQVFNWIHNHLEFSFDKMNNLSKEARNELKNKFGLISLQKEVDEFSNQTKTKKFLFRTIDNKKIESVVIPDKERNTLCISTQVGCPLDCKFCATGLMGYKRNLSSAEIVDQYLLTAKDYGKDFITNIVYMGMGEPLLNYDNTIESLKIFTNELNKILSRNRITVSTSGIPHKIVELADTNLRVKLALSLHSAFNDIRDLIMPINKKYKIEENIEAIKYYTKKTKTRITFEYTMLKGINDRNEDVKGLAKLCSQIPSKINIIPFNSIAHMQPEGISAELIPTEKKKIYEFAQALRDKNVTVMIRDTQGDDIAAACGQLAIAR